MRPGVRVRPAPGPSQAQDDLNLVAVSPLDLDRRVMLEWDEKPGGPVVVEYRVHRWIVPDLDTARREAARCFLGLVIAAGIERRSPYEDASPWWAALLFVATLLAAAWSVGVLP